MVMPNRSQKERFLGVMHNLQCDLGEHGTANLEQIQALHDHRVHTIASLNSKVDGETVIWLRRRLDFVTLNFLDVCLKHCLDQTLDLKENPMPSSMLKFHQFQLSQIASNLMRDATVTSADKVACEKRLNWMRTVQSTVSACPRLQCKLSDLTKLDYTQAILTCCGSFDLPVISAVNARYDAHPKQSDFSVATLFVQQLDADLQHRIITPLLHMHLKKLATSSRQDEAIRAARQEATQIYSKQLQEFVSAGLGEITASSNVWDFLGQPCAHGTGYVDTKKQELLLKLLLPSKTN